jgi:transcriptional regulator with XRE-family HTH domain
MVALARIDGSRIKRARLGAGMTQTQLARAINTSERNIARWENGPNQPRVSSVAAIAAATGQSIDYFLTPNGDETSDDDEEADALTIDDFLRLRIRQMLREEAVA